MFKIMRALGFEANNIYMIGLDRYMYPHNYLIKRKKININKHIILSLPLKSLRVSFRLKVDKIYMIGLGHYKWYYNRSPISIWGSVLFGPVISLDTINILKIGSNRSIQPSANHHSDPIHPKEPFCNASDRTNRRFNRRTGTD